MGAPGHGTCSLAWDMRPSFTSPIVVGLLALATVMGCRRAPADARGERPSAAPAIEQTRSSSPPGAPLGAVSFQEGFAAVVERVAPTVANVSSLRVLRAPYWPRRVSQTSFQRE